MAHTFTTGQAAAAAGVTRKAIRVYEERGLLEPPARTPTGYRRFDRSDIDRMVLIRRARSLGLQLRDIQTVLDASRAGTPPCATVRDLLTERIDDIDLTMAELRDLRADLVTARDRHHPSPSSGDDCPIITAEHL